MALVIIGSLYIAQEDKNLDTLSVTSKHKEMTPLEVLHSKFENIDIDAKNLDLDATLIELEEARKLYPLDDKLKMISIELNHQWANKNKSPLKDKSSH